MSNILLRAGAILLVLAGLPALSACSDGPTDPDDDGLRSFEFAIRGRTSDFNFIAQTSDPQVIADVEEQLALPPDQRERFPNGPIARGDGGHNFDWGWHFVPDEWELTDFAIEVCDGNPSLVDDDLDYWIDTVGRFCPWGGYVVGEADPE